MNEYSAAQTDWTTRKQDDRSMCARRSATILILTTIAISTKAAVAGLSTNTGSHALTEILFGFASSLANNGQAFAGFNDNMTFYNIPSPITMMAGRFGLAIPEFIFAGMLARQKERPQSRELCAPTPSRSAPCLQLS